jgi:hypothetical protein
LLHVVNHQRLVIDRVGDLHASFRSAAPRKTAATISEKSTAGAGWAVAWVFRAPHWVGDPATACRGRQPG